MPNWCTNHITVQGPEVEIRELLERSKQKNESGIIPFTMQALHPTPQVLLETEKGYLGGEEQAALEAR